MYNIILLLLARYLTAMGHNHVQVRFLVSDNQMRNLETKIKEVLRPYRYDNKDTEVFFKNVIFYEQKDFGEYAYVVNMMSDILEVFYI